MLFLQNVLELIEYFTELSENPANSLKLHVGYFGLQMVQVGAVKHLSNTADINPL